MFLDPEVPGEHKKIWGPLCYGVSSKAHRQGLQVVLSKTTTMNEPNKEPILAQTLLKGEKVRDASFGPDGGQ